MYIITNKKNLKTPENNINKFIKKNDKKNKKKFFKFLIKCLNRLKLIDKNSKNIFINYQILINFSISNIIFNITNVEGKNIVSASSGILNYSSSQKKNKHALLNILHSLKNENTSVENDNNFNFLSNKNIILSVTGPIKKFNNIVIKFLKKDYNIVAIKFKNLTPHNGCKPKKLKRLKKFFI
uniref:Ribosomal protein S11 n=1 Tax=Coscinodiscus granii TaxID=265552 RepID=A0A8A6W2C0_9STRA|nr:ribosomal protein S11 [Coscinodiscus granii]QTK21671.1 ribosomal protein S11 [Coscinodiscus granii]